MRFAVLIVPFLLGTGTSVSASEQDARQALSQLNNYIDAISFSDACLGRSDIRALEPIAERIDAARARVTSKYDQLVDTGRGDIDYECHRTGKQEAVSHRAIRRETLRLVEQMEFATDH